MLSLTSTGRCPTKMRDAEWSNRESSLRTLRLGTRSSNKFLCIPRQNSRDQIPHGAVEEPTTETETHGERSLCYLWVTVLQDRQRTVQRGLRVEIITRRGWHSPILLHALHAAESGCMSIVVTADYTDVLVLFLAMFNKISWRMYRNVEQRPGPGSLTWSSSAMHGGKCL